MMDNTEFAERMVDSIADEAKRYAAATYPDSKYGELGRVFRSLFVEAYMRGFGRGVGVGS